MKATVTIFAVVIGLAGSAGAVEAQYMAAPPAEAAEVLRTHGTYDAARVRAQLDHARQLAESGRFGEARKAYRAIAEEQKAAGVLAGEALWRRAALEYGRGGRHQLRAALLMDELAEQAAIYGDPALQARALIEAAILYHQHRRPEQALSCINRLQPLLQSPYLTQELRQEIESRIRRS